MININICIVCDSRFIAQKIIDSELIDFIKIYNSSYFPMKSCDSDGNIYYFLSTKCVTRGYKFDQIISVNKIQDYAISFFYELMFTLPYSCVPEEFQIIDVDVE